MNNSDKKKLKQEEQGSFSYLKNNPVAGLTISVLIVLLILLFLPWPFDTSVILSDGRVVRLIKGTGGVSITSLVRTGRTLWAGSAEGKLYTLSSTNRPDSTVSDSSNSADKKLPPPGTGRENEIKNTADEFKVFSVDGAISTMYPTELNLWGGFSRGAFLITGNSGRLLPLPVGDSSLKIAAFAVAKDKMWVGTDKGLLSYDFTSWASHPAPEKLSVLSLLWSGKVLYAGTDKGLYTVTDRWSPVALVSPSLDKGSPATTPSDATVPAPSVNTLFLAQDELVICGTDSGIFFIKKDDTIIAGKGISGSIDVITNNENTYYAGGSDGLYFAKTGQQFTKITGLPFKEVVSLTVDSAALYAGTPRGLFSYEFTPSQKPAFSPRPTLDSPDNVEGENPDLWNSRGKISKAFQLPKVYARQQIFFVKAEQEKGIVWCGTEMGLFRFNRSGKYIERRHKGNGLPDNHVHVIDFNGDKTWFGTMGGLALLENGRWTSFTRQSGELLDNNVWALYSTDEGLWIGTDGGLQFRSVQGRWQSWTISDSPLKENWIQTITSNSKGVVFVGVWNGGIGVFENGSKTRTQDIKVYEDPDHQPGEDLLFNDGLISDAVTSVVVDDNDHLWAATAKGLCRFDGDNWFDYTHKDWHIANSPLNYLEVGKDDKTILVCGSDGMSIVEGNRFRKYSPLAGSGSSILVKEGSVSSGNIKTQWIKGAFPDQYCWSVAIIDHFAVIGTAKGLVALEFDLTGK